MIRLWAVRVFYEIIPSSLSKLNHEMRPVSLQIHHPVAISSTSICMLIPQHFDIGPSKEYQPFIPLLLNGLLFLYHFLKYTGVKK
jgi:hypothetical protein